MLCRGEYLYRYLKSSFLSEQPYSAHQEYPPVNFWKRSISNNLKYNQVSEEFMERVHLVYFSGSMSPTRPQ